MLSGPIEDGIQPAIAAEPCEGAFDDPSNAVRDELFSVPAGCDDHLHSLVFGGSSQLFAFVAAIAEQRALKSLFGQSAQGWQYADGIVNIGRGDADILRETVLIHGDMQLDAFDFLAAIDASLPAGWG